MPSHTPLLPDFSGKCQEKIILLGFEVSVVSKEEPGLNKLEDLGGPSGLPSCVSPRDRAKTSLGSFDTSFHVEQLCPHSSESVISILPYLLPAGGNVYLQSTLDNLILTTVVAVEG